MNIRLFITLCTIFGLLMQTPVSACTGITLKSKDQSTVVARTIEWAESAINTLYVIVPRNQKFQSLTPSGMNGIRFTAKHGYVGLAVEQKEFIVEGINEKGLSAGLFYFPQYGKYQSYEPTYAAQSLSDFQVVSYVLARCSTTDEVKEALQQVRIINLDPRASTVHWRFTDISGKQMVLEIVDETLHFYDNPLGVLTNAPGIEWHWTNLNNYINLQPGNAPKHSLGTFALKSLGQGSGLLGLPGDFTPPSRFVRAAFFQTTAPIMPTAEETVVQAFHLLNHFDVPTGTEFPIGKAPANVFSATQFTVATDIQHQKMYYRTMYNSHIRCIDLQSIDFNQVKYQAKPLDATKKEPIEKIQIE